MSSKPPIAEQSGFRAAIRQHPSRVPRQESGSQEKKDDTQGQQTKAMSGRHFAAVSANTQLLHRCPTREKFVLAMHDSVGGLLLFTWAGILAGQARP